MLRSKPKAIHSKPSGERRRNALAEGHARIDLAADHPGDQAERRQDQQNDAAGAGLFQHRGAARLCRCASAWGEVDGAGCLAGWDH